MSSLLKEAIVDATALKEQTKERAKEELVDQFSEQFKGIFDSLLSEADMPSRGDDDDPEDEVGMDPDMGMDPFEFEDDLEGEVETDFLDDQIPYSFANGEKLCKCPDNDEEIEIDFDDLMQQVDAEEMLPADMIDREETAEEYEEDLFEEIELDDSVLEKLIADFDGTQSGWTSRPTSDLEDELDKGETREENPTPEDDFKEKAYQQNLEKEKETLYQETLTLKETIKLYKTNGAKYKKDARIYKTLSKNLKNKLQELTKAATELTLSNSQYFYENRVLRNSSLNERQKVKLVDAISNTKTAEEAKIVFETLQNTVTSADPKSGKSGKNVLNEMFKKSSFSATIRSTAPKQTDGPMKPEFERMQLLAGIKTKQTGGK